MARILVVDDESNVRMMLRIALQHVGHVISTAADGPEGLERYGDGSAWDLVLLDQRMPGMEGLEVLREIRKLTPHAKVILITAFGTIDLANQAVREGASDFLRKPFTAEILRGAVEAVLREGVERQQPGLTTINGFRVLPKSQAGKSECVFVVESPEGERQDCTVKLSNDLVGDIEEQGRDSILICSEALANYLWQNAELPPNGILPINELPPAVQGLDDPA